MSTCLCDAPSVCPGRCSCMPGNTASPEWFLCCGGSGAKPVSPFPLSQPHRLALCATSLPPPCLFNALGNFSIYIQIAAAPRELKAVIHCSFLPVTPVLPAREENTGTAELAAGTCWSPRCQMLGEGVVSIFPPAPLVPVGVAHHRGILLAPFGSCTRLRRH